MKTTFRIILHRIKIGLLACFIFSLIWVILYRFIAPPVTPLMLIRVVQQIYNGKEVKMKKAWVPLSEISPYLQLAVVASEDQKFVKHYGFDFEAIQKAWRDNGKKKNKNIKGGSTITQQVAKNAFLWPGRSWVRKGLEAYFTVLIELCWSKERILEVYLNIIETGNGIYGVEAIAQTSFKRNASKLNKEQAALIAAIIPNPLLWTPDKPTYYINNRKTWIVKNMSNLGKVAFKENK